MTTHETIRSAKLWESGLKYAVDTQSVFLLYIPMIGKPTWNKPDVGLQQSILESWVEAVDDAGALAAIHQNEALEENIANIILTLQTDPAELAAFRDNLVRQQDSIIEAFWMDIVLGAGSATGWPHIRFRGPAPGLQMIIDGLMDVELRRLWWQPLVHQHREPA